MSKTDSYIRAVFLIISLSFMLLIGCGKTGKADLDLPIKAIKWGSSQEDAVKALGTAKEEITQEGLTQLLWSNVRIWNEKATLLLRFDTTADNGLFYAGITFPELNEEKLVQHMKKEYGEPVRKDGTIYIWENKSVGDLPDTMHDQVKQALLGDSSEIQEGIWNTILKEPLVRISLQGNKLLYDAEHMALVRKLESN